MNHPLTYATIACVRRDGRYSRRPPRRQNSSETILPPPPSFYSADHPLIVSSFSINSPIFKILCVWIQIIQMNDNYLYPTNRMTTNLQRKNVVKVISVDLTKVVAR